MNRTYYRQHSNAYFERTVNADAGAILQCLLDCVPPPARVLDLGCGSGRDLAWLKANGYTGFGIEASPELARLALDHCGGPIIVADFAAYPLEVFEADLIIAVGSLVHIPHSQLSPCIEHLLQGLKRTRHGEGRRSHLYLSFKAGQGRRHSADGRIFYFWQADDLREVFTGLGLRVIQVNAQPSVLADDDATTWLGYLLAASSTGDYR